jgi:putative Mg2+ transporter-C (MgtC) family protein
VELDIADVGLRLGSAALAGIAIGINRDLAQKPIGVRTLGLVALGAATVTVAATGAPGMMGNSDALSRVIQGVIQGIMAGISFIGAGVILRDAKSRTVEGLTTAASVWVTAAVGIACGLGAWSVVLAAVAITLVLLLLVGRVEAILDLKRSQHFGSRSSDTQHPAEAGHSPQAPQSRDGPAPRSPMERLPLGF